MFTRWILLFTLAISSWSWLARASYAETSVDNFVEESTKSCPSDGIPVCGARGNDYFLFPNECLLNEVNEEDLFGQGTLKKVSIKYCIHGCNIMCPQSYDPVCTLNVFTRETKMFNNMCEVTAHACRTDMEYLQVHPRACNQNEQHMQTAQKQQPSKELPNAHKTLGKRSKKASRKPVPCTSIMNPVCGIYKGVKSTFKNECLMNAENVKFGKDWRIIKYGICDEDYSNNRRTANHKASKPHYIKKRSYGDIQHRNRRYMSYRPQLEMSNNELYMYMPHVFQTHYVQHELPSSSGTASMANHILQKIMSLPTPHLVGGSPSSLPLVEEEHFGATNEKSISFPTNSMEINYKQKIESLSNPNLNGDELQQASQEEDNVNDQKFEAHRAEHVAHPTDNMNLFYKQNAVTLDNELQEKGHFDSTKARPFQAQKSAIRYYPKMYQEKSKSSSVRQSMEINSYAENSDNQNESFYHNPLHIAPPTTPNPRKMIEIPTTATRQPIFIIARRVTSKKFTTKTPNIKSNQCSNECEFGGEPICGVHLNGTVKTFQTFCEMVTSNKLQNNTWRKLHNGTCETCKTNCFRDYKPVCVQRNGVNYTMVNDCYFNMGICMDKRSKWKKISDGECKRYIRIPDKYADVKPGFHFTSKYFPTASTQPMRSFTPTPVAFASSTANINAAQQSKPNESSRQTKKRVSTSNPLVSPLNNSDNSEPLESCVMILEKRKRELCDAEQMNGESRGI